MTWTYASHTENDRQPRNRAVDRAVATQYAGRARTRAMELKSIAFANYAVGMNRGSDGRAKRGLFKKKARESS